MGPNARFFWDGWAKCYEDKIANSIPRINPQKLVGWVKSIFLSKTGAMDKHHSQWADLRLQPAPEEVVGAVCEAFNCDQRRILNSLAKFLKRKMAKKALSITGYNIGVNCGESAVQTIFHVHCHMIPRLDGDIEDPRRIFFCQSLGNK